MQRPNILRRLFKVVFYVLLLLLPIVAWVNRYSVYDWVRLRNYEPTPVIQAITEKTTMTPSARRVFYANHPKLEASDELRNNCQQSEFSIVLGCYISGQGIFLFDVSDPRLEGVEEITAAHEMLHAGYDRLSGKERDRINVLLDETLKTVDNPRILATIEQYRSKDPKIVQNELHSILGSEYRNLPTELEDYYKRYFTDRSAVVSISEKYESEFTSRQVRVKEYDQQIAILKNQIDANEQKLSRSAEAIQAERDRLNRLAQSQDVATYNAAVDGFNRQVDAYNALAAATQRIIDEHNSIVAARNALAVEVNNLSKAIDTRPQGIPAQ